MSKISLPLDLSVQYPGQEPEGAEREPDFIDSLSNRIILNVLKILFIQSILVSL